MAGRRRPISLLASSDDEGEGEPAEENREAAELRAQALFGRVGLGSAGGYGGADYGGGYGQPGTATGQVSLPAGLRWWVRADVVAPVFAGRRQQL